MQDYGRYIYGWQGLQQLFRGSGFVEDARALSEIPSELFDQALESAATAPGFLEGETLDSAVSAVTEPVQREALSNFISVLSSWKAARALTSDAGQFSERLVQELDSALQDVFKGDLRVFLDRARSIAERTFPGVDLALKATKLAKATGAEIDRIRVVCDLRPVFDDARQRVEGLIPITTLKIVSHGEDAAHPSTFEVHLTQADLDELTQKLALAKQKVSVIKAFVEKSGLVVPEDSE